MKTQRWCWRVLLPLWGLASSGALSDPLFAPPPLPGNGSWVNNMILRSNDRSRKSEFRGPLRIHPGNPRYFTDDGRRAVYLTGSHTWLNFQTGRRGSQPLPFDYERYLDFLQAYGHNFTRLWTWESAVWVLPDSSRVFISPLPYRRTGPGRARDGGPKFDLRQFDEDYFTRLKQRVARAEERGFYVSVMLFQGFSVARKSKRRKATPWEGHPFHRDNNVNGVDGDLNGDGEGYEVHTLQNESVLRLQEAYVRKVIDTVNEFDNVLYEISNESHGGSAEWQYHMIRLIHRYESTKPKRHPIWMSFTWDGIQGSGTQRDLFDGPADAVAPGHVSRAKRPYRTDPPPADGSKVVIPDTDHLWGIGGNETWVWKSFLRGLHPVFMDPYRNSPHHMEPTLDRKWEGLRRAMGDTLRLARKVNLAAMVPTDDPDVCSTRYCLQDPGREYLVYRPEADPVRLRLPGGIYRIEWFDPALHRFVKKEEVTVEPGTSSVGFQPPTTGPVVLHVVRT